MNKKSLLLVLPIVFIGIFFVFFEIGASLAPQVYFTELNFEKRSFEPGEEIKGYVSILNYEELVMSDLVFRFQLLGDRIDGVDTKIIDEEITRETFTLSSGREIRKAFNYNLPANLPQGDFKFRVQVTNSRGEEMGWIDKIISVGGEGKFLTLDNHWVIKEGEKLPPGGGASFDPGQTPEIQFDAINNSSFSIVAFPKIITYKRNVSDILKEEEEETFILEPGEKKTLKFSLSGLEKPEVYLSEVKLYEYEKEARNPVSNAIYFRLITNGEDAEILFVKSDKISYKANEEAKIEIQIAGPPDYSNLAGQKGVLEVKLFNSTGQEKDLIGQASQEIDLKDSKIMMNVLITKDVEGPEINTKIISNGKVIDEYNFRVVPEEGMAAVISPFEKRIDLWIMITKFALIFIALIIMGLIIYNFKTRKINIFRLFLLILLGACFWLFGFDIALAAVEISGGCQDTIVIYNSPLPNRMYNLNDVIHFSGKFKTTNSSSGLFFNKISFYITEDEDISVKNCCGYVEEYCLSQPSGKCLCKEGYIDYFGASSGFYAFSPKTKAVRWFDEVKLLDEKQDGVYKIGTIYPSDTVYGDPWVAYNQSFVIPDNLGITGPVRLYVQYSGTRLLENWQWNISYQKAWISDNKPPRVESANFDGPPVYCGVNPGEGRVNLKWTYQDPDKNKQSQYHLQIATGASFNKENLVIDNYSSIFKGNPSGNINTSPSIIITNNPDPVNFELGYNQQYYWRVRVQDEYGLWSNWRRGPEFRTSLHAYPWPEFKWAPESPIIGKVVSFIDSSKCYRTDGNSYDCRAGGVRYKWDFDYDSSEGFTVDSGVKGDTAYTYSESGEYTVRLEVTDDIGKCSVSENIAVGEKEGPPPVWKPTYLPPSWLELLLSRVSGFLKG